MKKYYADRTCLNLLRVFLFTITLCIIIAIKYYLQSFPRFMWLSILVLAVLYLAVGIIWLPLYFSRACYMVSSREVIRCSGFFFQVKQFMKVEAIQYVTLVKTPFSRLTGLNFVIINALGGNLLLLFLSRGDAEEIERTLTAVLRARKGSV